MIGLIVLLGLLAGQEVPAISCFPASAIAPATTPLPPPVVNPANPPKVVEPPALLRAPTDAALSSVYPERALWLAIPGRAVARCHVRLTGKLEGCSIIVETPEGMGFGDAALRLTSKIRMTPLRHDGVAVDAAEVVIPFNFPTRKHSPWQGAFNFHQALGCFGWHKARLEALPSNSESARGVEHFSAMARKLGAADGIKGEAIERGLARVSHYAVPDLERLCRLAS